MPYVYYHQIFSLNKSTTDDNSKRLLPGCNFFSQLSWRVNEGKKTFEHISNIVPNSSLLCILEMFELRPHLCILLLIYLYILLFFLGQAGDSWQSLWDSEKAAGHPCRDRHHWWIQIFRAWSRLPWHSNPLKLWTSLFLAFSATILCQEPILYCSIIAFFNISLNKLEFIYAISVCVP